MRPDLTCLPSTFRTQRGSGASGSSLRSDTWRPEDLPPLTSGDATCPTARSATGLKCRTNLSVSVQRRISSLYTGTRFYVWPYLNRTIGHVTTYFMMSLDGIMLFWLHRSVRLIHLCISLSALLISLSFAPLTNGKSQHQCYFCHNLATHCEAPIHV